MFGSIASLLAGVVLAGLGGELFLRGVLGFARWVRIPTAIAAATLGAFATSSPELSVAVNSALAGNPGISLGDALGSNVVNVALILGLSLAIAGPQILCPLRRISATTLSRPRLSIVLMPLALTFRVIQRFSLSRK